MRRDERRERRREHSPCRLRWLPQYSLCVYASQANGRTAEGRTWPDLTEITDLQGGKKRKLERKVEVLVQLDQALCNGLFGLAHEALVADCRCLAVCCSDMQDYTMCSHRERRASKRRERRRAEKEKERKGRWEVKGLKQAKEKKDAHPVKSATMEERGRDFTELLFKMTITRTQ